MNEKIQKELQSRIESFANDVTVILQRAVAGAVADSLGTGGGRVSLGKAGASKGRGRGSVSSIDPERLLREIAREGGRRSEEIARSLGIETKALVRPMKDLIASKKVKTSGQARGTKYRAS